MTAPAQTRAGVSERYYFLSQPHDVWSDMKDIWIENEARYEGGHRVRDQLWRFDWESLPGQGATRLRDGVSVPENAPITSDAPLAAGEHYQRRQGSSIYTNFMDSFATDTVGALMQQAPTPVDGLDFGTLGKVRRKKEIAGEPSRAELAYYNIDGVGLDGTQWDNFWARQMKLAMVTGYRWIFIESPPMPTGLTQPRQGSGIRPYLIGYSPTVVTNWQYVNNRLDWAVMKLSVRRPRVEDGRLVGNSGEDEYMLFVRRGVRDLGTEFAGGGWFRFDSQKNPIPGQSGNWGKTNGDIPMVPLFYEKHDDIFGRPALTELGNAGIAGMNIHSAADFDAFDRAGTVHALEGADVEGFNLFISKILGGNRYAPLPNNRETGKTPTVGDVSGGSTTADVFEKRWLAIVNAVDRIVGNELKTAAPDSGLAQQAGYALGSVPRLSIMAGNMEESQNSSIPFLEMRWGETKPTGSAKWKRDFQLIRLTSTAQAILQLMQIAGIHSATLESRVIISAARNESYISDDPEATTIENELMASAAIRDKAAALAAVPKPAPGVPGERARATPPEPAQTNDALKTQMDGPNVE